LSKLENFEREISALPLNATTNGRLFKCPDCGLEANRDAVGVLNIGRLQEVALTGSLARLLLLVWDEEGA